MFIPIEWKGTLDSASTNNKSRRCIEICCLNFKTDKIFSIFIWREHSYGIIFIYFFFSSIHVFEYRYRCIYFSHFICTLQLLIYASTFNSLSYQFVTNALQIQRALTSAFQQTSGHKSENGKIMTNYFLRNFCFIWLQWLYWFWLWDRAISWWFQSYLTPVILYFCHVNLSL